MNLQIFNSKLLISSTQKLQDFSPQPQSKLHFHPSSAASFQEMINSHRFKIDCDGVILITVRQEHQVLFNQTLPPPKYTTFVKEENAAERSFVYAETMIPHRISKKMFSCFLIMEELKTFEASRLFMHISPGKIFKKLEQDEEDHRCRLDMFKIVYRLLRGEYASPDDFYDDIVTMINDVKSLYFYQKQIFTQILQFEAIFWHLKEVEVPRYSKALQQFARQKHAHKVLVRNNPSLREERANLERLIIEQRPYIRKRICQFLKQNIHVRNIIRNGEIDLRRMPIDLLREAVFICGLRSPESTTPEEQSRYYTAEEICENLRVSAFNPDDIYEGSSDEN